MMLKKPVREAYLPLAQDPAVQDATMKQLKVGPYAGIEQQLDQIGGAGEEAKVVI